MDTAWTPYGHRMVEGDTAWTPYGYCINFHQRYHFASKNYLNRPKYDFFSYNNDDILHINPLHSRSRLARRAER